MIDDKKYKISTLGPLFPANTKKPQNDGSLSTIYQIRLSEFQNNDTQFYSVQRLYFVIYF